MTRPSWPVTIAIALGAAILFVVLFAIYTAATGV